LFAGGEKGDAGLRKWVVDEGLKQAWFDGSALGIEINVDTGAAVRVAGESGSKALEGGFPISAGDGVFCFDGSREGDGGERGNAEAGHNCFSGGDQVGWKEGLAFFLADGLMGEGGKSEQQWKCE
jgi:hypothetical protein